MSTTGVHVADLTAGYWRGQAVLDRFSISVTGPGVFHLAAPNGAGKSTLFEVLAGYLEPSAGSVRLAGQEVVAGRRVRSLRVQRSEPSFVPGITLSDHFHLYARRYGAPSAGLRDLAVHLGLADHLGKAPEALSTGSLKKAWFVCHAAGDEPVWCLDEPFNGVDAESAATMAAYLAHAGSSRQVILTAHLLPAEITAVGPPLEVSPPFLLRRVHHG